METGLRPLSYSTCAHADSRNATLIVRRHREGRPGTQIRDTASDLTDLHLATIPFPFVSFLEMKIEFIQVSSSHPPSLTRRPEGRKYRVVSRRRRTNGVDGQAVAGIQVFSRKSIPPAWKTRRLHCSESEEEGNYARLLGASCS